MWDGTSAASGDGKVAPLLPGLDAGRTTPYDFYQYWINTDDRDVERFLAMYTFLPMEEVKRLGTLEGAKIREGKQVLAYEATVITHGKEEADRAREAAQSAFGGDGRADGVPVRTLRKSDLEKGIPAIQLFADAGLAASKSEARRLIKQGGGYINKDKITDIEYVVDASVVDDEGAFMLRAGKKRYHRIRLKEDS